MLEMYVWCLVSIVFIELKPMVMGNHAILIALTNSTEEKFCLSYFPFISPLPQTREEAKAHKLLDLTPWAGCDINNKSGGWKNINGKVVVVSPPNCTLIQKAKVVQENGGSGVLVVSSPDEVLTPSDNETEHDTVNITLAVISNSSLQHIKDLGPDVKVLQFAPPEGSHFDYSLIIIWFMAMFSIILGACWGRIVTLYLSGSHNRVGLDNIREANYSDKTAVNVTPMLVICFVVCMCGMLLLLYFFYSYLVYVIIAMFCLASTLGLYHCLEPFVLLLPIGRCRVPSCNIRCLRCMPSVSQLILLAGCVAITMCWFIYRKHSFAWILQDILGIAFTINMLNTIKLPSFKICTILLVLLFFYDIFFVFITPLFTMSGKSVMVDVALGRDSNEQMPMVLIVPHFNLNPLSFCSGQYSLLGFGDILVPGLLVSYCYNYDIVSGSRKVYFIAVVIGYGTGLIFTFAGLHLMSQAQPALLYLVPCMLILVTIISLLRKEFRLFWKGEWQYEIDVDQEENQVISTNENIIEANEPKK